ncbi:MAG: small conductance mechanosensitive channel [Solirubrobacteraceae bacterium]|nr:small conductance mechanosensitive channel [Solirubrobacteraceae bacterium]
MSRRRRAPEPDDGVRRRQPAQGWRRRPPTPDKSWFDLGAARELSRRAAKRARVQIIVVTPLLGGVFVLYAYRRRLFPHDWDPVVRILFAVAIIALGWQLAREVGRALRPVLTKHLEPATAGTVGFLIRLWTMLIVAVVALRVAGLGPQTLAVGGALTAVVLGLAAQQTIGNVIAGTVLASAQPFRVGDRVRLQGGGLAGTVEGTVTSLGLLYTVLANGEDAIMIPNSVVMNVAVVPLREPTAVDMRARLRAGVTPAEVERLLRERIRTPIRGSPRVSLEELDGDELVVRIAATPVRPADGPVLASEVLDAIAPHAARQSESRAV